MKTLTRTTRALALLLAVVMVLSVLPVTAFARSADATLTASLAEAKGYIDSITINSSSNDPEKVVKTFKTHFTWDNEKRENSKSYLFDWSYYNGVVFEGIEYVYEATGEQVYRDYVIEYMSSLIASNGTWAKCTNSGYTSKQCAGYDATHGADCYMTAALLVDCYEMTGDSRYLTIANTLYADLDSAASKYSLSMAGNNFRHTWASDPSPDLWLDGLYMILPFRAEYAKYIGDTEELDLIVSRMQWVSDNMYNSSRKLFYHAADSASSNSGTFWLRSIGWYAAAIVDIMDHMEGQNLETMKKQLVKLVDGMRACQNSSNGMWLNNMAASQSSTNPYETSGTALTCYAVMKAVNKGWLDESYADMAILAFNGICREKLSNNNLTDICFKGAPGSSNSTFYDNEGKGLGPFIMFYAEMLKYVNAEEVPEETVPETTVPEETEPAVTEPEVTEPAPTEPVPTEPEATAPVYEDTGVLESGGVYKLDSDGVNSGTKYIIVYSGKALQNNNGVDANPAVTISNNTITLDDDSKLAWTITQSGSDYTVENNGSYLNLNSSGNDPIGSSATVSISRSGSTYLIRKSSSSGAYLRYSSSQLWCAGTNSSNNKVYLYGRTGGGSGDAVTFTVTGLAEAMLPGDTAKLDAAVTVKGAAVDLSKCTVTWSSSNDSCAAVSGGTVTAKGSGETAITATLTAVNGTALQNAITLTIPVSVQGHDYKAVVTKPTCTEEGFTTYTCAICGDSYVTDRVPALGHSYTSVTTEPTCTASGSIVHTCACGDSYTEVIPATGHSHEAVVTAPTCTEDGYTTYTCACGDSYVSDYIAALGHDAEVVTTAPTCTEGGRTVSTCARCGHVELLAVTEALGHDLQTVTIQASCETDGSVTTTCIRCGEQTVEILPALGHDLTVVTIDPTCTADGSVTRTCDRCGETEIEVLPAAGHSHEAVATRPTCTEGGFTTYTCHCGDSYVSDHTAALGHNLKTVTVAATCELDGSVTTACDRCDYVTVEIIPATGHAYESVITAPTCVTTGFTTNTCANCGGSYISDETAALGHELKTVTVDASCETDGSVTTSCVRCDHETVEILPALGHSYLCTEEPDCLVYTCEHCGVSYTESYGWTELGMAYVLDTDDIDVGQDHKYIVVGANNNYALTLKNGTISATAVNISGNTLTLADDSACAFWFTPNSSERNTYLLTQDGSRSVYHVGGEMKYGHDSKGYWYFGSNSNGSYQLYDYDNTNWYLSYGYVWASDSVSRFAVSSNARSVRLFQATQGYARLTGTMRLTCTDADGMTEEAILSGLSIQTSTNGTDIASTMAVTADQLRWDVPFDGTTAGVYTATVSYEGAELGTVTVTVTSRHTYEIVTVEPTCTEGGYTCRVCTTCGVRYELSRTEALGHSYTETEADGLLIHTCTRCGDSYSEELISYTKVTSLASGSRYVVTLTSGGKTYALSHKNNSLSLVQVTVSDGKITSEITGELLWDYSSSKLRYTSGSKTYSLYASSSWWGSWWGSSATLSLSTSNSSNVSFSGSALKIGSYYLTYSNGSAALSSSAGTVSCYIEN